MLKEIEETIGFFVKFLSLVAFQLGGYRVPQHSSPPLATPVFYNSETLIREMIRYAISQKLWHDRWFYLVMCSSIYDPVKQNLQL